MCVLRVQEAMCDILADYDMVSFCEKAYSLKLLNTKTLNDSQCVILETVMS